MEISYWGVKLSLKIPRQIYMTSLLLLYIVQNTWISFTFLQAINSPDACKKRLVNYVVPVVFISILVNIPKFLESEVAEDYEESK